MWMFRLQQRIMFTYRGLQHCLQKNLNVICINSWAIIWGLRLFPSHSVWSEPDRTQPSLAHFLPETRNKIQPLCSSDWDLQKLSQDWLTDWLGVWFLLRILWSINDLVLKIKINKTQCFQKHAKPSQGPTLKNLISEPIIIWCCIGVPNCDVWPFLYFMKMLVVVFNVNYMSFKLTCAG